MLRLIFNDHIFLLIPHSTRGSAIQRFFHSLREIRADRYDKKQQDISHRTIKPKRGGCALGISMKTDFHAVSQRQNLPRRAGRIRNATLLLFDESFHSNISLELKLRFLDNISISIEICALVFYFSN